MVIRRRSRFVRRWQRMIVVASPVVLLPTASAAVGAAFLTNDDVEMEAMADGTYAGAPSHQVPFVARWIGFVLRAVYALTDRVPWYPLGLSVACAVGVSLMLDAILRTSPPGNPSTLIVRLFPLIAALPYLVWNVSFTITAFVLAGGATLGLIARLTPTEVERPDPEVTDSVPAAGSTSFDSGLGRHLGRIAVSWAGVGLGTAFAVAAAIRSDAAIGALAVSIPAMIGVLVVRRQTGRVTLILSAVAMIALAQLLELAAAAVVRARSPQFADWLTFNAARGQLHGTPRVRAGLTPALLDRVGWSASDKQLFARFVYDDPNVFSRASIIEIDQLVPRRVGRTTYLESMSAVFDRFPTWWGLALAAAAMLAGPLRRAWFPLAVAMWWLLVVSTLGWIARAPLRVSIPLAILASVVAVVGNPRPRCSSDGPPVDRTQPAERTQPAAWRSPPLTALALAALVAGVVVGVPAMGIDAQHSFVTSQRQKYHAQVEAMEQFPSTTVFVALGGSLVVQGAAAFEAKPAVLRERVLLLGWPTYSPLYEARKASMGIADTLGAVASDPRIVFVSHRPQTDSYLLEYFREHRRLDVRLHEVEAVGSRFNEVSSVALD